MPAKKRRRERWMENTYMLRKGSSEGNFYKQEKDNERRERERETTRWKKKD